MKNKQQASKMTTANVGIVGCGWLGSALAKQLLEKNIRVKATTAHQETASELSKQGIEAQQLLLPQPLCELAEHDIFSCQQLVICIPPRIKQGQADYPEKMSQLVAAAEIKRVKKIILISTTAVYNGLSGDVFEDDELDLTAEKVAIIEQAEQSVLNFNGQSAIIRMSGLIGPSRHPGRFFGGKTGLANPDATVNLIHQHDAVGLILSLLNNQSAQGIFNGVAQTHVSRQTFYKKAALALSLAAPVFGLNGKGDSGKRINADKARLQLSYVYLFDNLLQWMDNNEH